MWTSIFIEKGLGANIHRQRQQEMTIFEQQRGDRKPLFLQKSSSAVSKGHPLMPLKSKFRIADYNGGE
jgi:hypothetical protein